MQLFLKSVPELSFLEQESLSTIKHEYHNGEVVNMAGASEAHNLIVSNLIIELGICLKGKNCKIYPSDMLLKLEQCKKYVYPDVMLVCKTAEVERKSENSAEVLLNPAIVIEVLSPSTALYDKTEKKRCYQMLDSLQQYVMIDSTQTEVISYTRIAENDWLLDILQNLTEEVLIGECLIKLADIYANIALKINK